jgi:DNA ligase-associated metallophosphoesterase
MIEREGDVAVDVRGEKLWLLPERALYWDAHDTLLVADPHFGKAATFRAGGIPVPEATTGNAVARLEALADRTAARRIVFLGDFLHARPAQSKEVMDQLARWRRAYRDLELLMVRGNHDRHAGDPPGELTISCVDAPVLMPPFILSHHPKPRDEGYVLAGHVHPAVRLSGKARESVRLPCFVFGAEVGVLPAFGYFTGSVDVEPAPGDRVFALSEDGVIDVSAAAIPSDSQGI